MAKLRIDFKSPKKYLWPLNVLTFNLSRLIPFRDKHLWIFGAWEGAKYDDNSRYLMEYIIKHHSDKIRCVWMTNDPKTVEIVRGYGYEAYLNQSAKALWLQMRAGVAAWTNAINDFGWFPLIGGAEVVHLSHGVSFKKCYNEKYHGFQLKLKKFADFFFQWTYRTFTCYPSEYVKNYEMHTYTFDTHEMYLTGMPRNDVFKTIDRNKVLSDAGLDPKKKIIAYMPTYRQPAMGKDAMANIVKELSASKELNDILEKENATFVCKLHPLTPHIDIPSRDNFIVLDYKAVKNNQELLGSCDMIISDYSGTILDFALLNRPVAFYMPDEEKFAEDSEDMYKEFFEVSSMCKATTPKEIANLIAHPSKEVVATINDYFLDKSIRNTCFSENVYKAVVRKIGI